MTTFKKSRVSLENLLEYTLIPRQEMPLILDNMNTEVSLEKINSHLFSLSTIYHYK